MATITANEIANIFAIAQTEAGRIENIQQDGNVVVFDFYGHKFVKTFAGNLENGKSVEVKSTFDCEKVRKYCRRALDITEETTEPEPEAVEEVAEDELNEDGTPKDVFFKASCCGYGQRWWMSEDGTIVFYYNKKGEPMWCHIIDWQEWDL